MKLILAILILLPLTVHVEDNIPAKKSQPSPQESTFFYDQP